MFSQRDAESRGNGWLPIGALPGIETSSFYHRLDRALEASGFGDAVRELCEPFDAMDRTQGDQTEIDPEVYFKMQMVGFFEEIPSERGIAARCADSLSIRQLLRYGLHESTPDHSSLTVYRERLGSGVYEKVFALLMKALRKHKLLRGRRLRIDASEMESNASMRLLAHRLTGEQYWKYVEGLGESAGAEKAGPEILPPP
jgi:transposase